MFVSLFPTTPEMSDYITNINRQEETPQARNVRHLMKALRHAGAARNKRNERL